MSGKNIRLDITLILDVAVKRYKKKILSVGAAILLVGLFCIYSHPRT